MTTNTNSKGWWIRMCGELRRDTTEWALIRITNLPYAVVKEARRWENELDDLVARTPGLREWLEHLPYQVPFGSATPELAWGEGPSLLICGPNGTGKTTLAAHLVRQVTRLLLWGDRAADGMREGGWLERVYLSAKMLARRVDLPTLLDGCTPHAGWCWYENWLDCAERVLSTPVQVPDWLKGKSRYVVMSELQMVRLFVLDDIDSGAETEMREALLRRFVDWAGMSPRAPRLILIANATTPEALMRAVGDRIADRFNDSKRWRVIVLEGDSKRR